MSKINQLVNYLKDHSIKVISVSVGGDKIVVEDNYTLDCVGFSKEVVLNAELEEIRNWLGY